MFEKITLITFAGATAVQLFFWLYFFARLVFYQEKRPASPDGPPVSVIICAHNEEANLRSNLDRFLNQTYRSYEVLVVLHNSSDKSSNVLASLQRRFKHLRFIECDDPRPGKKHALATGIEQAKNNVLLLTDADCVPASDEWISGMVAGLNGNTHIVLGVAPYEEGPGPLNKFIRYEACYTAMQYLSFALAGLPYMGVGRNLAYQKALFDRTDGFQKHEHLASGDDDLFINEVATRGNTGIRLDPTTFTYSPPKNTLKSYFRQKTRHFSTGQAYKLHHKVFLSVLAMSHFLHYLGGFMVALNFSIIFALLGYAVRMCVVMALGSAILKRLRHPELLFWLPVLDALLILYYVIFTPAISMNNDTQKWN